MYYAVIGNQICVWVFADAGKEAIFRITKQFEATIAKALQSENSEHIKATENPLGSSLIRLEMTLHKKDFPLVQQYLASEKSLS